MTRRKAFPHRLLPHSRLAEWSGHTAFTVYFWTFHRGPTISLELEIHEYVHGLEQILWGGLAAALVLAFGLPLWLVVPALLSWFLAYFAVMPFTGYERHPSETRARRIAAETWRDYRA